MHLECWHTHYDIQDINVNFLTQFVFIKYVELFVNKRYVN